LYSTEGETLKAMGLLFQEYYPSVEESRQLLGALHGVNHALQTLNVEFDTLAEYEDSHVERHVEQIATALRYLVILYPWLLPMHSSANVQAPLISVVFYCPCDKVYH